MESQHMTQQEFANYVGMSAAALSSIFNERTKPTLNTVEAIKNKIPGISLNWLMFGVGDMYDSESNVIPSVNSDTKEQLLDFNEDDISEPEEVSGSINVLGVQRAPVGATSTEVKYYDKQPLRKITEIRVFFDDQTYESFVPKN